MNEIDFCPNCGTSDIAIIREVYVISYSDPGDQIILPLYGCNHCKRAFVVVKSIDDGKNKKVRSVLQDISNQCLKMFK
jgi:hypothetical protein